MAAVSAALDARSAALSPALDATWRALSIMEGESSSLLELGTLIGTVVADGGEVSPSDFFSSPVTAPAAAEAAEAAESAIPDTADKPDENMELLSSGLGTSAIVLNRAWV